MKAVIEIPKGDDRRRHYVAQKKEFVDFGPIKEIIPVNNGVMPVDYGFLPDTRNIKEGDEIDVLVLSKEKLSVGQSLDVEPVALLRRDDGDDKIVAADRTTCGIKKWEDIDAESRKTIVGYFGFRHKIVSIESSDCAKQYIERAGGID